MTTKNLVNRVTYKTNKYSWDVAQIEGTSDIYINKQQLDVDCNSTERYCNYKRVIIDSIILPYAMETLKLFTGSYNDKYIALFKSHKLICWDDIKGIIGELVDSYRDSDSDSDYYLGDIDAVLK